MCNSEMTPILSSQPELGMDTVTSDHYESSSDLNSDPDMTEVMNTLRILSHPTISRTKSLSTTEPHARCVNCNGSVAAQRGIRSREDILRNLNQLEVMLASRGEKLPNWVQAYKQGDSIRAAKLLHLSYMARKRSVGGLKRKIVQEATSTTMLESEDETSLLLQNNNSSKAEDQAAFSISKKPLVSE